MDPLLLDDNNLVGERTPGVAYPYDNTAAAGRLSTIKSLNRAIYGDHGDGEHSLARSHGAAVHSRRRKWDGQHYNKMFDYTTGSNGDHDGSGSTLHHRKPFHDINSQTVSPEVEMSLVSKSTEGPSDSSDDMGDDEKRMSDDEMSDGDEDMGDNPLAPIPYLSEVEEDEDDEYMD